MFRQNLGADAAHADMLVTAASGSIFQERDVGQWTTSGVAANGSAPFWVKAIRSGDNVRGYTSADGSNWTLVSSSTLHLTGAYYVGLAVTSGSDNDLNTAEFSDVTVSGTLPSGLPAEWSDVDIGSPLVAGRGFYSQGANSFTLDAGGTGTGTTSDQFHFAYQTLQGDGSIIARVQGLQNLFGAGNAGVMIREGLGESARNVAMILTATTDAQFQVRSTQGGMTAQSTASGSMPGWVRITREGDTLTGYVSEDGIDWTEAGSTTLVLTGAIYVGLVADAGNSTGLNTICFDNVMVQTAATPGIAISGAPTSVRGMAYTLMMATSDPSVSSWEIDWGDGQVDDYDGSPTAASHIYSDDGEYTIQAWAWGDDSYQSNSMDLYVSASPALASPIIRLAGGAGPTAAQMLSFSVSFAEPVSGVDASDFYLSWTGISGPSITGLSDVSGDGSSYLVTVASGWGDGTLQLHLGNDDSIHDTRGARLTKDVTSGTVTIDKPESPTLATPTGLLAVATSSSQITLTWNSTTDGVAIEVSSDGSNFTQLAQIDGSASQYVDANLSEKTTRYYRVRAKNGSTISEYSPVLQATTMIVSPANLQAGNITDSSVDLSWSDGSAFETGFILEMSTNGLDFAPFRQLAANATSIAIDQLQAGTPYWFRISATSDDGDSAYSNLLSVRTAAPSLLRAQGSSTAIAGSRTNLA